MTVITAASDGGHGWTAMRVNLAIHSLLVIFITLTNVDQAST